MALTAGIHFRPFAAERFVRSSRTQKTKCGALQWLPTRVTVEIDDADAALHNERNLFIRHLQVLLQTSAEQFRLANERRPTNASPSRLVVAQLLRQHSAHGTGSAGRGRRNRQLGRRGQLTTVVQRLVDQVVFCLQSVHQVRSEHVLAEFLQTKIF